MDERGLSIMHFNSRKLTVTIKALFSTCLVLTLGSCSKGCNNNVSTPENRPSQSTEQQPVASSTVAVPMANNNESQTNNKEGTKAVNEQKPNVDLTTDGSGLSKSIVVLKTSKGTLKFKLYSNDAPNTVKRFVELVQTKFYNGLSFHRVVPGFVVQTGDPKSKNKNDPTVGSGGSGIKQKAEFNKRKHIRGAVAMARAADHNSADSQFYIMLGVFPHLDENYTVFGQVIDYGDKSGDKDVLDRIRQWDDILEAHIE